MEIALELDIPYTELEELGYAKSRLIRDVNPEKSLADSRLWIEPITGTLMLKPMLRGLNWLEVANYDYQVDRWESSQIRNSLYSGSLIDGMRTTLNKSTLIETLILTALSVIDLDLERTLYPVLNTSTVFPANQGFYVNLEVPGLVSSANIDYAGIAFGDFFFTLHTDGTADLYWSSDGSRSQDTWIHRKHFNAFRSKSTGGTLSTSGICPASMPRVMILPFGRGNIYFRIETNGQTFHSVYTHPEATWDGTFYNITTADHVTIYVNGLDQKNFGVAIAPLKFHTSGVFTDFTIDTTYPPTVAPVTSVSWVPTMGAPTVTDALVLEDGAAAWSSDGTNRKCRMKLTLQGDGSNTPFVDAYRVSFAEKNRTITPPKLYSVGGAANNCIESLSIGDGESWDDQRIEVKLRNLSSSEEIADIIYRSRINGQLLIDDVPYMLCEFETPKTTLTKAKNTITLTGKNLGVSRVLRKKFFYPPNFDNWTHPGVIEKCLKLCGFSDDDIVITADTVKLPQTEKNGEGTDEGKETEFKSQPDFNSPVSEFLEYIIDTYSRWPLRYASDAKWYYQPLTIPTTGVVTFYGTTGARADAHLWYDTEPEIEIEPPEGNQVVMIGETDDGQLIANTITDLASINGNTDGSYPLNYLGCIQPIIWIDKSLNKIELIDDLLEIAADAAFEAIVKITWKGPFSKLATVGAGVTLENIGLVQVISVSTEAKSPVELEKCSSTTYTGRLILADSTAKARSRNERDRFLQALNAKAVKSTGKSIFTRRLTTAQKKDEEQTNREILSGNITWGTPVVRNGTA